MHKLELKETPIIPIPKTQNREEVFCLELNKTQYSSVKRFLKQLKQAYAYGTVSPDSKKEPEAYGYYITDDLQADVEGWILTSKDILQTFKKKEGVKKVHIDMVNELYDITYCDMEQFASHVK